jgi:hypothetical protein
MSTEHSTAPATPGKPTKPNNPYPDLPLTDHPAGYWCEKIRGKLHYFGPWADPDAALKKSLEQKDALHAGRKPRLDLVAVTVKNVANAFLRHKDALLAAREMSPRTRREYQDATVRLLARLGKQRIVADLGPDDFADLRKWMASQWGHGASESTKLTCRLTRK